MRFGEAGGRYPREAEVTHDIHLARVYLLMRELLPTRAASWVSEEGVARTQGPDEMLPDAQVIDGLHRTAIEFAGAYPAAKLQAFHDYCASRGLAYEIW
jgi:hypothetical protein